MNLQDLTPDELKAEYERYNQALVLLNKRVWVLLIKDLKEYIRNYGEISIIDKNNVTIGTLTQNTNYGIILVEDPENYESDNIVELEVEVEGVNKTEYWYVYSTNYVNLIETETSLEKEDDDNLTPPSSPPEETPEIDEAPSDEGIIDEPENDYVD